MGHERVGYLPKTKRWNTIVESISDFAIDNDNVESIASDTIRNVSSRFLDIPKDGSFLSAFKFLLLLSFANKQADPVDFLRSHGLSIDYDISQFQLAKIAHDWVIENENSKEYSSFSSKVLITTINQWISENQTIQQGLFSNNSSLLEKWEKASTGAGFCEISRIFFSKFTSVYLNYFLERSASSQIKSFQERELFKKKFSNHIDDISTHAFEISKIGQSFSAGWYNKHTKSDFPSNTKIKNFLSFMMKKLSDELKRSEVQ